MNVTIQTQLNRLTSEIVSSRQVSRLFDTYSDPECEESREELQEEIIEHVHAQLSNMQCFLTCGGQVSSVTAREYIINRVRQSF